MQNGAENLLQQERQAFAKQGALQVEKARQEAELAGKRTEQQEHQIIELRAKVQTAEAELQVAHSDCVKTLRYCPRRAYFRHQSLQGTAAELRFTSAIITVLNIHQVR